jgi:gliding motility-associated-like protein
VEVDDRLNGGEITLQTTSPLADTRLYGNASVRFSANSAIALLNSNLCWTPNCELLSPEVYAFPLVALAEAPCKAPIELDTVLYFRITEPENRPPTWEIIDLPTLVVPGDSVCFSARLRDPDAFALLGFAGTSESFTPGFGFGAETRILEIDTISNTEYILRLCLKPNCHNRRQTYSVALTAWDSTRCDTILLATDSWSFEVDDCHLNFVNVFSPNGDGINDFFRPILPNGIQRWRMWVFDRWGNQVFAGNWDQGWDGNTPNGKACASGVYFYRLDWEFESGTGPLLEDRRNGSVTLLR